MNKSYLPKKQSEEIRKYNTKYSYIASETSTITSQEYTILPEEYSIFSEVNNELFFKQNTLQEQLISLCLNYLKEKLIDIFLSQGIIGVLPKLNVLNDDENNVTINWFYSNYRIFFSFDSEKANYQSFCGVVLQEDNDSFSSHSKKITKDNYKDVVDNVLKIVINNS